MKKLDSSSLEGIKGGDLCGGLTWTGITTGIGGIMESIGIIKFTPIGKKIIVGSSAVLIVAGGVCYFLED